MERFGGYYFNIFPSVSEHKYIERKITEVGFPGCIGSVFCINNTWNNCPSTLKGQYLNTRDPKSVRFRLRVGMITAYIFGRGFLAVPVLITTFLSWINHLYSRKYSQILSA